MDQSIQSWGSLHVNPESRKNFGNYRKVSYSQESHNELENFSLDPGIYFSREDKFIGRFTWKNRLQLKREYLEHYTGTSIYHTRIQSTKVQSVAQIVVIHGWASSSNFVEIGCEFAKNGIICHLFDMRGFGYSGGPRRNSRIKDFLEDLHLIILQCRSDLPLFIYGHSLGGFVAMIYLILNKIKVSGVIFTAPFFSIPHSWRITVFKEFLMNAVGSLMEVSRLKQVIIFRKRCLIPALILPPSPRTTSR